MIYLSVPHMGGSEKTWVDDALANYVTTAGPNLKEFEARFSTRVDGRPCVAVASGTAAIHLGLRLLGVRPGDEVFCSTLTFAASANPIRYLGAEPVFLDSNRETWNIDPDLLAKALAKRADRNRLPKAIIVVHLYGQIADMEPVMEITKRYGIPVLEDAAEALGATYRGQVAGTFGEIAAFSFNGNKIITTGGGGMLAARQPACVEKARFWSTQAKDPGLAYEHSDTGYNYRLSNVLAGIGIGQLEVLDLRVRQRRAIAARYREAFADLPGIEAMPEAPHCFSTNWLSCFLLADGRDRVIESLSRDGIEARPVWKPMHMQALFAGCESVGGAVAEDLFRRGICLPSSSKLTPEEQERVIQGVRQSIV